MPAGRPRKPTELLEISGSFRKNPSRRRAREGEAVKAPGIGVPPAEWTEGAATNGRCASLLKIWQEIIDQDILGVLNVSHRILVENTCLLVYKVRRASSGFGKATSGDFAQIKANLAAMGMTPADSSRVAEAVRVPERSDRGSRRDGHGWGELVG